MKRKVALGLLLAALGAPAFAGMTFRQVTKIEIQNPKMERLLEEDGGPVAGA